MSTAARLVEVGRFAWHHSSTEKLISPSTFVHHFSILSLPLNFLVFLLASLFKSNFGRFFHSVLSTQDIPEHLGNADTGCPSRSMSNINWELS